jgi:hypothetical protein
MVEVQTNPRRMLVILSEVIPGSDKIEANARNFVRSDARFGQNRDD